MKILSMTATFGKLEQQTLTLKPGLNILQAPNEWGKSTWCAFLVAMLYGIETRLHSTKATLADKERYAPWSGSPMSGTLRILWNGKDITVQRSTKGRIPLGEFRAYETDSGLPVRELTAANCGTVLLGVEKSVFLRSGFLRLSDLPVSQDEALRRRLNALVTTGDESGTGEQLAQKLKELRNRCRFNRTGLLPQAEAQQAKLEAQLEHLHTLQAQTVTLSQQQAALETRRKALENHRDALEYQKSLSASQRLQAARSEWEHAQSQLASQEALCASLPSLEAATQKLSQLRKLQDLSDSVRMDAHMLPSPPEQPEADPVFSGLDPDTAIAQARTDRAAMDRLRTSGKRLPLLPLLAALLLLPVGILLLTLSLRIPGAICLAIGLPLLCLALILRQKVTRYNRLLENDRQQLLAKYRQLPPDCWVPAAREYADQLRNYFTARDLYAKDREDLAKRSETLKKQLLALTDGTPPSAFLEKWTDIRSHWESLEDLRRKCRHAREYYDTLASTLAHVAPPAQPDELTCSEEETAALLSDCATQLRQLHLRLGQTQGQMDALGEEKSLQAELSQVRQRITRLENTYAALVLAQETLTDAALELQRRFAPRITQRTRELFSRLTGNRYTRVSLDEHLDLSASAHDGDILRSVLWRSDGTADQLYLALRLAVAEALSPEAPLVLDDALVRFDDDRLAAALEVLKEEAKSKQILLFTCQSRERQLLKP